MSGEWNDPANIGPKTVDFAKMPPRKPSIVKRVQPGLYRTHDGRYEIQYESWYLDNECECIICLNGSPGCPNDGWGKREGWTVWSVEQSDHVTSEPFEFQTYGDARDYLAELLANEVAAVREP